VGTFASGAAPFYLLTAGRARSFFYAPLIQKVNYSKWVTPQARGLLPDALNANHELVKDGWCRWYRKHEPGDTVLEGLETEAREAKKRKAKRDARVHLAYTSNLLPTSKKFWLGLLR
jgi:hypothetical protein